MDTTSEEQPAMRRSSVLFCLIGFRKRCTIGIKRRHSQVLCLTAPRSACVQKEKHQRKGECRESRRRAGRVAGRGLEGNFLLSLNSVEGITARRRTDSCTKTTSEMSRAWITNRSKCVIIDTPGLNDSNNEDTDHIRGMVQFFQQRGTVDSFLLVRNRHNIRMNHAFRSMLHFAKQPLAENPPSFSGKKLS